MSEDDLPGPGLAACDLFDAIGERGWRESTARDGCPIRSCSAPKAAVLEERLKRLDLLVVCDAFLSETAAMADVVLPVTQWAGRGRHHDEFGGARIVSAPSGGGPRGRAHGSSRYSS